MNRNAIRPRAGLSIAFLLCLILTCFTTTVSAQVFSDFEVDGNVTNDGNGLDDWGNIFEGYLDPTDADPGPPDHPAATAWIFIPQSVEGEGVDTSGLTGGDSKDDSDISLWTFDPSPNHPDKNEIQNAFAALYICPQQGQPIEPDPDAECEQDDIIAYIGMDRYAVDGTAQMGFWLLNSPLGGVGGVSGTTILDEEGNPAQHTEGDFLVQVDVINGGADFEIRLYQWLGGDGIAGALSELPGVSPTSEFCVSANNPDACGATNDFDPPIPSPWPYTGKNVAPNAIPFGGFFEARFNLTQLIGVTNPDCTAGFIAETRASAEVTAVLKDVAYGTFQLCGLSLEKFGPEFVKVGDEYEYSFRVTNTGGLGLYVDTITDDVIGDLEAAAALAGCDFLEPAEACEFSVNHTVGEGATDPLVNTVSASYNPFEDLSGDGVSAEAMHSADLLSPAFTVVKEADMEFSKTGDLVGYTVTLTNTGDVDLVCVATDSQVEPSEIFNGALPVEGDPVVVEYDLTMPETPGDGDFENTVEVDCAIEDTELPNVVDGEAEAIVGVFEPNVTLSKSADRDLSKVGDEITYTITVTNSSTGNAPALECAVWDALWGDDPVWEGVVDDEEDVELAYTVQEGDPDPLENTATAICNPVGFPNQVQGESNTVEVNLFQPSVEISKSANRTATKLGDELTFTIEVTNTSSDDTPPLSCTVTDALLGERDYGVVDTVVEDDWSYTVTEADADPLVNSASVLCTLEDFANEVTAGPSEVSLPHVHPDFTLEKSCVAEPVPAGASANFRINLTNTGDVALLVDYVDVLLSLDVQDLELGVVEGECVMDDDPSDGCYEIEAGVIAKGTEVFNTVTASATLPEETGLPNVIEREAEASCLVAGGATRTRGFWQTHASDGEDPDFDPPWGYTCHVFDTHMGGTLNLGWKTFDTCGELVGGFWANNAKGTNGKKRSQTCQALVQTGKQAIAAALNDALSNGSPLPSDPMNPGFNILERWIWEAAKANPNRNELLRLAGLLDAYNNSGDDEAIIDDDGTLIDHADPKGTRAIADESSVDCN